MGLTKQQFAELKKSGKLYDVTKIREDFPILKETIQGKALVYLDNAATTQKPQAVIDALVSYYSSYNANIHRGIHTLAEKATAAFEETRESVHRFLHSKLTEEIIFTKGTTESINLVASSWGRKNIRKGDEIIVSGLEHHSNMVPWQMLAAEKEATVKIIPVNEAGELLMEEYEKMLTEKTKIVAVNHVSNTLGTINPIKQIIDLAHSKGSLVLVDGAQAASHLDIDVVALNADFYCLSGHKIYGPTGIGILYGKKAILDAMPPYQGGGEMIKEVSYSTCSFNDLPYKFEAGTPNIADAIALKSAIDYLNLLEKENIRRHENEILVYATGLLSEIEGLKLIGTAKEKVSINSFIIEGVHHQDIGILLDQEGIAVRTGHHCTQPLMGRFNITGTSRASYALYTSKEEVDKLVQGIRKAVKMLR